MKIQLTPRQVLELAIMGIDNGNIQAARDVLKECLDQLPEDKKESEGANAK